MTRVAVAHTLLVWREGRATHEDAACRVVDRDFSCSQATREYCGICAGMMDTADGYLEFRCASDASWT
jgi:hypothetical protein